ncbi:MAG: PIG-L family deacetylase [Caldilineales bacterium]|nr:PIG-L family deacetylase [Caldilineales bacterium]
MRYMAVGAHPDDIEMFCAGTLVRAVQAGHDAIMCVACDGSGGHTAIGPVELTRIRGQEAQSAASIIGAEFIPLGYPDMFIFDDRETRLIFADAIRRARPDVIITHWPHDYHADHRIVSQLVFAASFLATLPNIKTDHPAYPLVTPIYYMDTPASKGFVPTEYVDITETYETKQRMLSCHESQVTWLKEHDNVDILEFMETMARSRGTQCGVRYAEGFRFADVWPRTVTRRLLP